MCLWRCLCVCDGVSVLVMVSVFVTVSMCLWRCLCVCDGVSVFVTVSVCL